MPGASGSCVEDGIHEVPCQRWGVHPERAGLPSMQQLRHALKPITAAVCRCRSRQIEAIASRMATISLQRCHSGLTMVAAQSTSHFCQRNDANQHDPD